MKNVSIFFICSLFILQTNAQNIKRVVPIIEHVTVFLNQAQILANTSTLIPAGNSKIVLEDIANSIDQNSIQISGKGDFTLLGVKYSVNYLNAKMNLIQDSIKLIKTEIENLEMLLSVANNEEKMIMANASIKNEKDGVLPEELKEMIDFFRAKLTEVGSRRLQILRQIEPLKDKKGKLEMQLNENMSIKMPLGQIELSVSAAKTTSVQIAVTYMAFNAGWAPNYDIRVKDTKSPIVVAYKAGVYQNTGIDWKNVKLSLSTSDPQISGQKPQLFPQYLSFYEPKILYKSARSEASVGMMDAVASPAPMAEMQNSANFTKMVETALTVQFDIGSLYTIPTGGGPEMVEIQKNSIDSKFVNLITPKLDNASFLTAKISDWEKYKFISGQANVYYEEKFLGKTYINESNVKDELEISLGRDSRIIGKREEIENFKARKAVGSNIKESFGFRTTIRNTKATAIIVILEDQVPVSQDSGIEVDIEELLEGNLEAETGKVKWQFSLEPGQSKDVTMKYSIKYPKDKKINNL